MRGHPTLEQTRSKGAGFPARAVRRQLQQILASADFDASRRSRDFLAFIVEEFLDGRGDDITQDAIATRVFGRKDDFDSLLDPIVRIQAGRLRRSLERYYLLGGKRDRLRIELPRGTYVPEFRQGAAPADEAEETEAISHERERWPAIAVGLFENAGAEAEESLAIRLQDELASELSRYRDARVLRQRDAERLAPALQPRFELQGRLHRDGKGWSVAAHLLDRATAEQAWADAYHTKSARAAEGCAEIARVIAARVGGEHGVITQQLMGENPRRPGGDGSPYAAILMSYRFFLSRQLEDLVPALAALRQLVVERPEVALAWTQLARLYLINNSFELTTLATPIDEAVGYAGQAVRLDPASAKFRVVLAGALLVKGEQAAARDELDHALRYNGDSLVYREMIGWLLAFLGDWERGIPLVEEAVARNPHHMPQAHVALWADRLRRGRFEEASHAALAFRDSTFFWRPTMRASCLGLLGRRAEAQAEVAALLRQKPNFQSRGRTLIGNYLKPPELIDRVASGLAKAGLVLR